VGALVFCPSVCSGKRLNAMKLYGNFLLLMHTAFYPAKLFFSLLSQVLFMLCQDFVRHSIHFSNSIDDTKRIEDFKRNQMKETNRERDGPFTDLYTSEKRKDYQRYSSNLYAMIPRTNECHSILILQPKSNSNLMYYFKRFMNTYPMAS
jgi:hypothetical protein